jgi:hypothetical protein
MANNLNDNKFYECHLLDIVQDNIYDDGYLVISSISYDYEDPLNYSFTLEGRFGSEELNKCYQFVIKDIPLKEDINFVRGMFYQKLIEIIEAEDLNEKC